MDKSVTVKIRDAGGPASTYEDTKYGCGGSSGNTIGE